MLLSCHTNHPPPRLLPGADAGAVLGQAGRGSLTGLHWTLGCVLGLGMLVAAKISMIISSLYNASIILYLAVVISIDNIERGKTTNKSEQAA